MSAGKGQEVRIEPGTLDDVPSIVHMLLRAVPNCVPQSFDQVAQKVPDMVVAKDDDGRILATATLTPVDDESVELRSVVVDESHRGNGFGRAFLEKIIDECVVDDRRVCCATRNRRFFERLGFRTLDTAWERTESGARPRKRVSMVLDPEDQQGKRGAA